MCQNCTRAPGQCVTPAPTTSTLTPRPSSPTDTKYFVTITVAMPYSKVRQERVCNLACYLTNQSMIHPCIQAEFVTAEQDKYKTAVARAAGTIAANIEIVAITEKRRRAGSVNVQTKVRLRVRKREHIVCAGAEARSRSRRSARTTPRGLTSWPRRSGLGMLLRPRSTPSSQCRGSRSPLE